MQEQLSVHDNYKRENIEKQITTHIVYIYAYDDCYAIDGDYNVMMTGRDPF